MHRVRTIDKQNNSINSEKINSFGPQRKNLGSIVRGYKSAVSTYARKNNIEYSWHKGFNDWIIWNDTQLNEIETYI